MYTINTRMEKSFDLDINNYTPDDLISFFKLEKNYSLEKLIQREQDLSNEILSITNSLYNSKYKIDIINFIKMAKEVLILFYNDMNTTKELKKKEEKNLPAITDPRIGKIINPLYTHQALEVNNNQPNDVNGYNYNTTTSVYVFNTTARNDFFYTESVTSTFELPLVWKNVISISLSSLNIPNVFYTFNSELGTNQIYIEEEITGISGIVTLPDGNYVPYSLIDSVGPITTSSFVDELTLAINNTLGTEERFQVVFNPSTHKITILNTTNNFTMNILVKYEEDICNPYSSNILKNNKNNKLNLDVNTYLQTMGYIMGYRDFIYQGCDSYTAESVFSDVYSDYLYFVLEDYTGAQTTSNTYGVLSPGVISKSILAVIPINSNKFTTTFDNNSNYIYKKRDYFGPVDISKISIKLLNHRGDLVNLQSKEFSFSLQIKMLYNLSENSNIKFRGLGFV